MIFTFDIVVLQLKKIPVFLLVKILDDHFVISRFKVTSVASDL